MVYQWLYAMKGKVNMGSQIPLFKEYLMEQEFIRQLAVIETQMSTLITTVHQSIIETKAIEARIDGLEHMKSWIIGGITVVSILGGVATWASNRYIRDIVTEELYDTDIITLICFKYRNGQRVPVGEMPKLCQ